jgi:hypothetical protein
MAVITCGAILQDQERQLPTLSFIRLNYFIFFHYNRRMDPITPYSEKIDLRTEHGRKIYEACTKPVSVKFDAVAGKHHSFVTVLRNVADERCWREICLVPIGTRPVMYDLLVLPGKYRCRFCKLIVHQFGLVQTQIEFNNRSS